MKREREDGDEIQPSSSHLLHSHSQSYTHPRNVTLPHWHEQVTDHAKGNVLDGFGSVPKDEVRVGRSSRLNPHYAEPSWVTLLQIRGQGLPLALCPGWSGRDGRGCSGLFRRTYSFDPGLGDQVNVLLTFLLTFFWDDKQSKIRAKATRK